MDIMQQIMQLMGMGSPATGPVVREKPPVRGYYNNQEELLPSYATGGHGPSLVDDPAFQAAKQSFIEMYGHEPATDSDFAEVESMMVSGDTSRSATESEVLRTVTGTRGNQGANARGDDENLPPSDETYVRHDGQTASYRGPNSANPRNLPHAMEDRVMQIPDDIWDEAEQVYLQRYGEEGFGGDGSLVAIENIAMDLMSQRGTDPVANSVETRVANTVMNDPRSQDADEYASNPQGITLEDVANADPSMVSEWLGGDLDAVQHLFPQEYWDAVERDDDDEIYRIEQDFIRNNPELILEEVQKGGSPFNENFRFGPDRIDVVPRRSGR